MHTYSMRDCPRERYILVVALAAVAVAAIAKQTAGYFGVVVSITTFSAFGALYFVFDRWLWQIPLIGRVIGIPNLAGKWTIQGRTDGADGVPRDWEGNVTIEQTWSQIAISIETAHSRSRSAMAAIERDPGHGFRIIYGYENRPKDVDSDLRSHRGTCDVVVAADLLSAEAAYFNDHQRRTFGTMKWSRDTLTKGT